MDINKSVTINAQVPANTITIYGYTSPNSRVELSNTKIFSVVYSQADGYFIFNHLNIPRFSQDLCLISQDESNRLSNPQCISSPPLTNSYTEIGPILLSPTLSLDLKNKSSSGQSIPNSQIKIYLYQEDSTLSLIKKVQAFSLPILETETDSSGNYSLNLPGTVASNYRIFATAQYFENNSPKSNTLLYHPNYSISMMYYILPIIIITIAVIALFKKKVHHYLPAIYYNKSITLK